jgi:hypothetical protein
VDLEDVGALGRRRPLIALLEVINMDVIHPLTVERDVRVRDRALAAGHQQLFTTVRMQEHQVGARLHGHGLGEIRVEPLMLVVACPGRADIDDVVVVVDRFVG